jgi:hypothetical protein
MPTEVNLFWLSGSYYMRRHRMADIKKSIGEHILCIFRDTDDGGYVGSKITEVDLFGEKKLVILKGFPVFAKTSATNNKKIINMLQNVPENCFVVIDGISQTGKPTIYKAFQKFGKVINFPKYLDRRDAMEWVADRLDKKNKDIKQKDIAFIVDSIGSETKGIDVDKLFVCVKKICDFLGDEEEITREDVIRVADKYNRFVVWGLFDAIDDKNFDQCVFILDSACRTDKLSSVAEHIFSLVLWRYRMLWFLKEGEALKMSNDTIKNDIKMIYKIAKSGSGLNSMLSIEVDDSGNKKQAYSSNAVKSALDGFYDKKPTINFYKRKDIFRIIKSAEESLMKIRYGASQAEIRLLLDIFLFCIMKDDLTDTELETSRKIPFA